MYEYEATVLNVVDGDTFDLDIDLGFHCHRHERVRILNVDTPEKRGNTEKELGQIVTDYAKKRFLGANVVIKSKAELPPDTDSFGRWLVDFITEDGKSVSDIYTELGVNKYSDNYSKDNVLKLAEQEGLS